MNAELGAREFLNFKREIVRLPEGRAIRPRASAYGLCIMDGRVLLGLSAFSGLWEAPGGMIEPGEEPIAAMRREFREETGFFVPDQPIRFLGEHRENFYNDMRDEYCDSTMSFFSFGLLGAKVGERDPAEVDGVRWFSLAELAGVRLHPVTAGFLGGFGKMAEYR